MHCLGWVSVFFSQLTTDQVCLQLCCNKAHPPSAKKTHASICLIQDHWFLYFARLVCKQPWKILHHLMGCCIQPNSSDFGYDSIKISFLNDANMWIKRLWMLNTFSNRPEPTQETFHARRSHMKGFTSGERETRNQKLTFLILQREGHTHISQHRAWLFIASSKRCVSLKAFFLLILEHNSWETCSLVNC